MKLGDRRRLLGGRGEAIAVRYLMERGFRILHRNWRCRSGELDIVADDGEELVFVEVRTRRHTGTKGTAEESVDFRKQRRVRETALVFMRQHRLLHRKMRFDVVTVTFGDHDGELMINHIKYAF